MSLFVVRRRGGWPRLADPGLERVPDELPVDDVRWIRSYVVHEADGGLGTVCVYQAPSAGSVLQHAVQAGLPVSEVLSVADVVLVSAAGAGAEVPW